MMNKECFKGGFCLHKGFTLVELLVVVLIIGILAAVALPQYNKAVRKAQSRELLTAMDALDKGFASYYLTNGGPEGDITSEDLDIALPELKYFKYSGQGSGSTKVATIRKYDGKYDGIGPSWMSQMYLQIGTISFTWLRTKDGTIRYCYPESCGAQCPPCEDFVNCEFKQVGTGTRCTF